MDPDPEMDPDPDPLIRGTEPRIRIHNKMSLSITVSKFARIADAEFLYYHSHILVPSQEQYCIGPDSVSDPDWIQIQSDH
jgi:hypothetical protein